MAVYTIKMPDIGEGIAEVELVEWHVKEGDTVVEAQVLADVMTEKATVQVPSPVDGKVLALGGKVGEVLAVGSDLVRLEVDASTPGAQTDTQAAATSKEAQPAAPASTTVPSREAQPAVPAPSPSDATHSPAPDSAQDRAPRPTSGHSRPLASPAVRRRALDE